jgi:hypothetical protein
MTLRQAAVEPDAAKAVLSAALGTARGLGAKRVGLLGPLALLTDCGRTVAWPPRADGRENPTVTTGHATVAAAMLLNWRALAERVGRSIEREDVGFLGVGPIGGGLAELVVSEWSPPRSMTLCDFAASATRTEAVRGRVLDRSGVEAAMHHIGGRAPDELYACTTIITTTNAVHALDVDRLQPGTLVIDYSAPRCFDVGAAASRAARAGDILCINGGLLASATPIAETRYLPRFAAQLLPTELLDLVLAVNASEVASCQLAALVSGDDAPLAPVIGEPSAAACHDHLDLIRRLGYSATPIACDDLTYDDGYLDTFRSEYGRVVAPR